LAQVWVTLIGFAFVPVYIRSLGIEVYGLIGLFTLLQALLPLLDMGMSPALSREMARLRAGTIEPDRIRDLLRSMEGPFVLLAAVVAFALWSSSGWLASRWLDTGHVPKDVVAQAIGIMGILVALRVVETIYSGSLSGLQRQMTLSTVNAVFATVRGVGAAAVLIFVSPSIAAFFLWQTLVSVISLCTMAALLYRALPAGQRSGKFSLRALNEVRQFASGMAAIGILSLILTQVDKILLSRLLPLNEFGYYMLAANVAGLLYTIAAPVGQAFLPRFVELKERGDQAALVAAFHKAAQLITVLTGALALTLMACGQTALHLWTQDANIAQRTAPLLAVLSLGILLNCLMWIPYQMQIAHGIVGIALRTNLVAVLLVVPGMYFAVTFFGPVGAAWTWVVLNAGYILITASLMYRKVLQSERGRWYLKDLTEPLFLPVLVALAGRSFIPDTGSRMLEFAALSLMTLALLVVAGLSASHVRELMCTSATRVMRFLSHIALVWLAGSPDRSASTAVLTTTPLRNRTGNHATDLAGTVCIGMPVYNGEAHVARALHAVLRQSYPNLQVVVSDNASTDRTAAICTDIARADGRVRYIRQTSNIGPNRNFEFCRSMAVGDYFMWAASDDLIDPGYVEECVAELRSDPDLALVAGRVVYATGEGSERAASTCQLEAADYRQRLRKYFDDVSDNGVFYGVYRCHLIRDCRMRNMLGADWILLAEVALQGKVRTIERVAVRRQDSTLGTDFQMYFRRLARGLGIAAIHGRLPRLSLAIGIPYAMQFDSKAFGHLPWLARLTLCVQLSARLMHRFTAARLRQRSSTIWSAVRRLQRHVP
jgi:O-antigen/teichoic acid export membrane protein